MTCVPSWEVLAVPCPQMDIGSSFTTIVSKALNIYGFFPYNTDVNFPAR